MKRPVGVHRSLECGVSRSWSAYTRPICRAVRIDSPLRKAREKSDTRPAANATQLRHSDSSAEAEVPGTELA
jgi:hypothetical protein